MAEWFIARRLRPAVVAYYAFARAADDIADTPSESGDWKVSKLDAMARDMQNSVPETLGGRLRAVLDSRRIPHSCALDLLVAFKRDAVNSAVTSLDDLSDYCRYSAAPVGRFLLALHNDYGHEPASDALCEALQILNHVQDCRSDLENMQRCYIPRIWLSEIDISLDDFGNDRNSTARQTLKTRMLDHAAACLFRAENLPRAIGDRRLAAQTNAILRLARRLEKKLRAGDPWQSRIALVPTDWVSAAASGFGTFLRH
ncbi:MAG: squalene/phytoene synthase family protein [Rhodobacteraceae bacterium]|nr:squalene/phytoene synthase family protein [Paracoccaceae bacterium]